MSMKSRMVFFSPDSGSSNGFKSAALQPGQIQKKKTVVIIDDEAPIARAVARMLKDNRNLEIQDAGAVASLAEAKRLLERHKPDIVISDKQFDMNNRNAHAELLAHLKENYPDAKVILHSASITESDGQLGYDAVVMKPVKPGDLAATVEALAKAGQ